MKRLLIPAATLVAALSMPMLAGAQDPDPAPIYGSELMTQQERLEYRQRMQSAQGPEEQERIRAEHHEQMQQRAREQGVDLPEAPPARGGAGTGMGPGGGPGMNQGQGMGPNSDNPMRDGGYREEHRDRMRDSDSADERQRIQQERQERMQEQIRDSDPSYERRRDNDSGGGPGGGGGMRN